MVALPKLDSDPVSRAPTPSDAPDHGPAWRHAVLALGLAWAATVVLFWPSAESMVSIWYASRTYNHGFLILPAALYLVWEQRAWIARLTPRPAPVALMAVLAAAIIWMVGDIADVNTLGHAALVLALQGAAVAVLGWRIARVLAFPLGFLFFAVPFGEFLVPPLQELTATFTVAGLRLAGIPVFTDGVFLTIPNGRFVVAEACAGVRFLIAMVALGALVAHLFMHTWWRRVLYLAIAIAVPIVANWIRAFGIVMIGYLSDMEYAVGVDHIVYGFIFFAIVMAMVLALGWWMREPLRVRTIPAGVEDRPGRRTATAACALGAVVLAAVGPAAAALIAPGVVTVPAVALAPPPVGASWWPAAASEPPWLPVYVGADAELRRTYSDGADRVDVYVAYYAVQREEAELLQHGNTVYDNESWRRAGGGGAQVTIDGVPLRVEQTRLLAQDAGRVVWQFFWVDGRFTGDRRMAKFLGLWATLSGDEPGAAAIALAADYAEDPAEARAVLARFVADMGALGPWLGAAAP